MDRGIYYTNMNAFNISAFSMPRVHLRIKGFLYTSSHKWILHAIYGLEIRTWEYNLTKVISVMSKYRLRIE